MNKIIKTLLVSMIALSLCHTMIGFTFPRFSDTEISIGNTFTAGVWESDADYLQVNTTKSKLTGEGDGRKLHGTTINNTGTRNITIDNIRVNWTDAIIANITEITIQGETFWTGSEPAGMTLDGSDYILVPSVPAKHITFWFDSDMSGKTFTIKFILGDGSTKEVPITPDSYGSCGNDG